MENNQRRLVLTQKAKDLINSLQAETIKASIPKLVHKPLTPINQTEIKSPNMKEKLESNRETPKRVLKSSKKNLHKTTLDQSDKKIYENVIREVNISQNRMMETSQESRFSYARNATSRDKSQILSVIDKNKSYIKTEDYPKPSKQMQKQYKISKSVGRMPQKNNEIIEHQDSQYNILNNTDLNQSIKSNDDLPKRPVLSFEDNVRSLGYLREYEKPDPFKEFEEKLDGMNIRKDALDQKIIRCKRNLLI